MEKMKYQYALELHKLGLCPVSDFTDPAVNRNSGCEALVRAVVAIGLVPNVANVQEDGGSNFKLVTATHLSRNGKNGIKYWAKI